MTEHAELAEFCHECLRHFIDNYTSLIAACASVGISHNMPTGVMVRTYFLDFHAKGHQK